MMSNNGPVLLLTRPREAAMRFAAELDPMLLSYASLCISPLLEIVTTGVETELKPDEGAIFTSAQGVKFAPDGAGRRAFCVGTQTAGEAAQRGWDVRATALNAENLLEHHLSGPIVHFGGRHQRGDIVQTLSARGVEARAVTLYDQLLADFSTEASAALESERVVVAPLFSPRTAAQFASKAGICPATHLIAMSDAVAQAAGDFAFASCVIATEPTQAEMLAQTEAMLRRHRAA